MSRDAVDGVATPVRFASLTDATERDLRALNAVLFPGAITAMRFYDDCRRAGGVHAARVRDGRARIRIRDGRRR